MSSQKKQFFKEEVKAYSDLFQEHAQTLPGRLAGKEGVPLEKAAELLCQRTQIPWHDQVLLLLKAYGQQMPAKYVLSGVSSVADIERHKAAVRSEL